MQRLSGMHIPHCKRPLITHGKQKIKREFLLVEGIQQIEFDTVLSISANAGIDPLRQQ